MASLKLKIGDTVEAIKRDYYGVTNSNYHWVGRVIAINEDRKTFSAVTTSINTNLYHISKGEIFWNLKNDCRLFAIIDTKEKPKATKAPKKDNTILCAKRRGNRIFIEYRGKVIAMSGCDEHDKFDEEFGLNLALRRACNKLKDDHEVTSTENVEDYL